MSGCPPLVDEPKRPASSKSKPERVALVNALLVEIGACGRRFFARSDRQARFELDPKGRIWFVDDYSNRPIYTHHTRDSWRGFSHGGTLRDLVIALRDFIRTGQPIVGHFGPWPQSTCGGDLWGYGEDMQRVRDAADRLGIACSGKTEKSASSTSD